MAVANGSPFDSPTKTSSQARLNGVSFMFSASMDTASSIWMPADNMRAMLSQKADSALLSNSFLAMVLPRSLLLCMREAHH